MRTLEKTSRPLLLLVLITAVACGGSNSSTSTPTSPTDSTPVQTNTITITAAGVSPKNVQIAQGSRVLFINNDTRSHNMTSDPHPAHTDCPPINSVSFLQAGQQVETGNMNTVRTCGFHDHDDPANTKFQGTIIIK